jgi:tetratricopeptide (TPR) repeat protein
MRTFTAMGAPDGETLALVRLGAVHISCRRYDTALECLDRALIIRREIGDRWGQGEVLLSRGQALAGAGQTAAARDSWQEALVIFDELSDPRAADARAQLATVDDELNLV